MVQHSSIDHTGITGAGAATHIADTTDAHDASAISFTPAGTIAATDVQAAIEEVAAEAGGGSFDPDEHMPWLIDINVYVTGITQTNFNTLSGNDTAALYGYWKQSSGAQNDEIGWDVILAAGTWTLELIHVTSSNRGIYTASLDAGSVGTIDGYDGAGPVRNVRSTITGISVAATGKKRLLLKMATKNASSSSYFGSIQHVSLRRTA